MAARLHALVDDALDSFARSDPEGFDLGVVALVCEVMYGREGSDFLKRTDAGYTPRDDVAAYVTYWCSDHRGWVQRGLFETAYDLSVGERPPVDEEEPEEDDGERSE